jgi:hypothetical protein
MRVFLSLSRSQLFIFFLPACGSPLLETVESDVLFKIQIKGRVQLFVLSDVQRSSLKKNSSSFDARAFSALVASIWSSQVSVRDFPRFCGYAPESNIFQLTGSTFADC